MGINYAEGWQKKKVSEAIREQGQQEIKKDSRQAAQTMEKLEAMRVSTAKAEGAAKTAQLQTPAKPEKPQGETQVRHEAHKDAHEKVKQHGDKAASSFIEARDKSRGLSQLLSKSQAVKPQDQTAARDAPAQKANVPDAQMGRLPQQTQNPAVKVPTVAAAGRAATEFAAQRSNDARRATGDGKRVTSDERRATSDGKQPDGVKIPVVAVAGETAVASRESRVASREKRADSKKKGGQSDKTGGVYGGKSGASRELGALLEGFGEGSLDGGGSDEQSAEIAKTDAPKELPEKDPEFHVYNRDRSNPVDEVKSKAQLFAKHIEKRLQEVAKLDEEVDGMIRNLFETQGLSGRIVGEIDDELRKELSAARFLYGTVYGGLIG